MSLEKYYSHLAVHGVSRTGVDGGEIALKRSDALNALVLLTDTDVGVLGGDVYAREVGGYFRPTYDNWHCDKAKASQAEFAACSHKAARDYVLKYNEPQGADVWYVFVLDR